MLSVDTPKYNKIRKETLDILKEFGLPQIEVYLGYTDQTISKAPFNKYMTKKDQRNEVACGMLDIFSQFVKDADNYDEWMLYVEDDVRPVNVKKSSGGLSTIFNVPKDAELIRSCIGKNEPVSINDVKYHTSYGGGLNHAFWISVSGCEKVVQYAKKYGWKYVCDIDIYRLSKFCVESPTGYDGWSFRAVDGICDISPNLSEVEKIAVYHMDNIIFNQTSLPCAPFIENFN